MKQASVLLCVIGACLALAGCGIASQNSSSSTGSSSSASLSSAASSMSSSASVRSAAIGEGDVTIEVDNATGSDIVSVSIKPSSQKAFSDANSFSGFILADGDTVSLSFGSVPATQTYDLLFKTSNDGKMLFRSVDLISAQKITLRFDQGVGFVTFVDGSGNEGDNRTEAMNAERNAEGSTYDTENQKG